MHKPYYDPEKTYEENYNQGPFHAFADGNIYPQKGKPAYSFLGHTVYTPFGIPAGPIINARFAKAAFEKGFDLVVYKTVRTSAYPCHPWPNIIPVQISGTLDISQANKGLKKADTYSFQRGFTNSFGVPSQNIDLWQKDMAQAVTSAKTGQLLIGSFQGTNRGTGINDFIADHVKGAELVKETGAPVIELNLSCPNEGKADILCFDIPTVRNITEKIKEKIGTIPLIIKIAFFANNDHLKKFLIEIGNIIDGISAINTIPAVVYDEAGQNQALPGKGRLRSGICGPPIKWAGLDMVKRLKAFREELNMKYTIIGVGGVISPDDYTSYIQAGADAVMSAIGSMWNPYLAQEIKQNIKI